MNSPHYIEWCNENAGRAYPLRDEATQRGVDGVTMPTDILVDAGIIVPDIHRDVYCTAVRVTSQLYAVAFASSAGPLLVGTYAVATYRPYTAVALTPLADNVSGWVVFGSHRAVVPESYRFAGPADSGLEGRAVRVVDSIPVRQLLKLGGNPAAYADQLATLLGANGLTVSYEDGKIIIALNPALGPLFRPTCATGGNREACGVPPIRQINGVSADENGQLILRFVPSDWGA